MSDATLLLYSQGCPFQATVLAGRPQSPHPTEMNCQLLCRNTSLFRIEINLTRDDARVVFLPQKSERSPIGSQHRLTLQFCQAREAGTRYKSLFCNVLPACNLPDVKFYLNGPQTFLLYYILLIRQ